MSIRSEGRPRDVKDPQQATSDDDVAADIQGKFRLKEGIMALDGIRFQIPGAEMGIAATYLALGDPEAAFSWLETAYRERNPQLMFLKVDERFSTLRAEPRFRDLLRRVRLL